MNPKKIGMTLAVAIILIGSTALASSSPEVEVDDGQIDTVGSTTTVDIVLNEAPDGLSGYNLTVSMSNASVAEIVSVNFPLWATLHTNSTLPEDSVWIKAADLMDDVKSGATNITLTTLTLRGDNEGTSEIIVTVAKMDDDSGYPIDPSADTGHLVVGSLCGDLTNDGTVDMGDVRLLLEHVGTHGAYEWRADVNCDGEINMGDVILLLNHVVGDPDEYELGCCE